MEIWLDTTDLEIIKTAFALGILDGVTTNPSLIAESGKPLDQNLEDILECFPGPVAAQVLAEGCEEIIEQAQSLQAYSKRIIPKIPVTKEGLQAIHLLAREGKNVMATALFEPTQALLAFKAGALYLAPYLGKIIDLGENGLEVLKEILHIKQHYQFKGKILAAGVRDLKYLNACLQMGLCSLTLKKEVLQELLKEHYGTRKALNNFKNDWKKAKPSPLLELSR